MKRYKNNLAGLGVVLAIAYGLAEALVHTMIFRTGTFAQNLLPHDPNEIWMRSLTSVMIFLFGLYAHASVAAIRRAEAREKAVQAQLDEALTLLLGGYVPICAQCKAIRENDTWVRVEEYVTQHTGALLSHGLCPACLGLARSDMRRSRCEAA